LKPLIGAEPYFFCLDTKNQDKKTLPPTSKIPGPALFVGLLRFYKSSPL
jgi:hypothetical protein